MRSTQEDQGGIISFSSGVITDAASGSGVGIGHGVNVPFVWTRTNTGEYTYQFDPSITPLSVMNTAATSAGVVGGTATQSAGSFRLNYVSNAGAATNINHQWVCTARMNRP